MLYVGHEPTFGRELLASRVVAWKLVGWRDDGLAG